MPTYVYGPPAGVAGGCDFCRGTFETVQPMSAAPLTACPKCGAPVERKIQPPNVVQGKIPASRMAAAGFTQYKRKGKGYYEKTFGKGPDNLRPKR